MDLQPVDSGAVEAVGYDASHRWLDVRWTGQPRVYRYYAVPPEVYAELQQAESVGAFLNERVKPKHLYEMLPNA